MDGEDGIESDALQAADHGCEETKVSTIVTGSLQPNWARIVVSVLVAVGWLIGGKIRHIEAVPDFRILLKWLGLTYWGALRPTGWRA